MGQGGEAGMKAVSLHHHSTFSFGLAMATALRLSMSLGRLN